MRSLSLCLLISASAGFAFGGSSSVVYVTGSSRKICQLAGDVDHETKLPTLNRTASRFGVMGTDEGFSFEHDGKIWFLFGDTWTKLPGRVSGSSDAIGLTNDPIPDRCIHLTFVTERDGGFQPPVVPGVSLGPYETPDSGFSANGKVYVLFNSKHDGAKLVDRTVLAVTADEGHTFRPLYEFSRTNFRYASAAQVVEPSHAPGLPHGNGKGVLIWGTPVYRKSNPVLAYAPADRIESKSSLRYFAGYDPAGGPIWSDQEADAKPLFRQGDQPGRHPCTGELSVNWNPFLKKWLMLYNCDTPRGINFRVADHPWGPWSEPGVLFDPWKDKGYCHFMHVSNAWWSAQNHTPSCDSCQDPHRDNEFGGEYAPFMISRYARGVEGRSTTIYYLLSTWNPYTVVLMTSTLKVE